MSSRLHGSSTRAKCVRSYVITSCIAGRARSLPAVAGARHSGVLITSKSMSKSKSKKRSHPHYLIATIDIDHLSGNRRSGVAGEKNTGRAELGRIAAAF
jgi:hypothetical protein